MMRFMEGFSEHGLEKSLSYGRVRLVYNKIEFSYKE